MRPNFISIERPCQRKSQVVCWPSLVEEPEQRPAHSIGQDGSMVLNNRLNGKVWWSLRALKP